MITREKALAFAQEWVNAWNSHDLDAVLHHYADDFEMSSPFIKQMGIEASGTLKGKNNVADYWRRAMTKYPDLRFEMHEVFSCVHTIIIYYNSVAGKKAAEFFELNGEGKVYRAMGHYD